MRKFLIFFVLIGLANALYAEQIIHKVKKGETIYGISRQYDIPLEYIYKANPWTTHGVKAGDEVIISKPSVTEEGLDKISWVEVKRPKMEDEKPLSKTEDVKIEVTDDSTEPLDSLVEIEEFEGVRIALILDDPNSKKDIDFTRGFLVGLDDFKTVPYKIDLTVMDGRISAVDLTAELENYDPNLIIATADRNFPLFLLDYGNTNEVGVVNVFDLKNTFYEDNVSVIQILPPSGYFNEHIAHQIYQDNYRRKLILIGEVDPNDAIASELTELFEGNYAIMSLEEFGGLEPDLMEPMLLYSYASRKEEVGDCLNNIDNLNENYLGWDFKIVGRSNWIALVDDYGNKFNDYAVIIPSRVYVDEESNVWKNFSETFESFFDASPVRSIPNYAASGYDMANYFIPLVGDNEGDFNSIINGAFKQGLQNDIQLTREKNWNGTINGVEYLIRFSPDGSLEKIVVR